MHRCCRFFAFGLAVALTAAPVSAARPLLDYHRLDAYFALFARDSNVPWKPTTVRLDTYTSAPVAFSAYQVDPADVIVAGSTTRPRPIDTRSRKPIATWQYVPPGGYRFQSNDVDVPLGTREGFFVVQARRGKVSEQVWIDRTRIGLLTKETPESVVLYAADLGTGDPLGRMRVSFIVRGRFIDRFTDRSGLVSWRGSPRPIFAMAQWGNSMAFVSFLPQAPLPSTIVGIKTASAVVHAGDALQIIGFARSRSGGRLRAGTGTATITLRSPQTTVAQTSVKLDAAGAFATALRVPRYGRAGEYTVIATVNGASAGTAVHVDANAAGLSLAVAAQCGSSCDASADVPLVVRAVRDGVPAAGVRVAARIIRSPHAYSDEGAANAWGVAQWYAATVTTGEDGRALVEVPHPSDGLASTYGVRVSSGGATANTRVVVPTLALALRITPLRDDIGSGTPAAFDVSASQSATGKPAASVPVRVELIHGSSVQQQLLTVDAGGHAHGAFRDPFVGSNLIVASAITGGPAMDASQVQVEPQTLQTQTSANQNVAITPGSGRYIAGQVAHVSAFAGGAAGSALITLESATGTVARVVRVSDGHAQTIFRIGDAAGALAIGAAFVRDGTLQWDSIPIVVDAPGRPLTAPLILDRASYDPGTTATARIAQVQPGAGTLAVRITRAQPTGSALFVTAPDLLTVGQTATQDTAADGASWHPWVDSSGDHAVIASFARRTAPPADLTMTQADTASVYWNVDRRAGDLVQLPVPAEPGRYVLSLLKVCDDGRVAAASGDLIVQ